MHREQQIGLVLRSNHRVGIGMSARICLLDKVQGRFDALVPLQSPIFCNGALIRYRATKRPGWALPHLEDVEQLHIPWQWASSGLAFVHHLLELCLCCIPLGSMANEAVDIIITAVYTLVPTQCTALLKKIVIVRLLTSLGIVSDLITVYDTQRDLFFTVPLDKIESMQLTIDEQQLQELIISCLQPYLSVDQLRTMVHLMELETL